MIISRDNLTKLIQAEFTQKLPGFRVFCYPMGRWPNQSPETLGILVQVAFLEEHITSHLRFPLNEGEALTVEDGAVERLVEHFRRSIENLISARQHREDQNLSFGEALVALQYGARVARRGWNGKDMLLGLIPGSTITVQEGRPLAALFEPGTEVDYLPHVDMKTADGKVVPWLCSQADMLATDWRLV